MLNKLAMMNLFCSYKRNKQSFYFNLILLMWKLRLREVNHIAQSHTELGVKPRSSESKTN